MKSASAKQKGRRLQQWVRDRMLALGPGLRDNDVTSRSSGAGGTDLILSPRAFAVFPVACECKNVERVNVWAAYAQASAHEGGGEPVVIISRNRAQPLAVVDAEWLLTLMARIA